MKPCVAVLLREAYIRPFSISREEAVSLLRLYGRVMVQAGEITFEEKTGRMIAWIGANGWEITFKELVAVIRANYPRR